MKKETRWLTYAQLVICAILNAVVVWALFAAFSGACIHLINAGKDSLCLGYILFAFPFFVIELFWISLVFIIGYKLKSWYDYVIVFIIFFVVFPMVQAVVVPVFRTLLPELDQPMNIFGE